MGSESAPRLPQSMRQGKWVGQPENAALGARLLAVLRNRLRARAPALSSRRSERQRASVGIYRPDRGAGHARSDSGSRHSLRSCGMTGGRQA